MEVPQLTHWGGGSHSEECCIISLPYKGELIPRAKELLKNATKQENHLIDARIFCVNDFEKQIVCKALFLSGQAKNGVKSGPGQRLQGFIAVVIHVDLRSNSAESEMVGNDEGIHIVILWQIRVSILELANCPWIM